MTSYEFSAERLKLAMDGALDFDLFKIGERAHVQVLAPLELCSPKNGGAAARLVRFVRRASGGEKALQVQATAVCSLRCRAVLSPDALLRVIDVRFAAPGEPLARLLAAAERGAYQAHEHLPFLAQKLGYRDWSELHAREAAEQHGGSRKRLVRELVAWTDLQAIH